ncbi:Alpha-amylase type B isozyme [Tetrabaena socialis]|uniref:alpha-amylase n=1 Tax=Tetrabaena socialis TaxID=47790 RepID=A0A2J8AGJ7_9CHLO|nr:Alpha-amylase type B isozyme [Tetrabaena socialis]|eukprot:PNH11658.1 Alpha-amylase type B isozyme [Tetrabaena socialis]
MQLQGRATGVARSARVPARARPVLSARRLSPAKAAVTVEFEVTEAVAAAPPAAAPATEPVPAPPPAPVGYGSALVLQGFAWDSWKKGEGNWYGKVQEKIPDIEAAGFTHVWLPPPSRSVSAEGYLPGQLYNLKSKYGNRAQLKELTAALNAAGMIPMGDIVINHRCADNKVDGVYNDFDDDQAEEHGNTKIDWGKWAITGDDPHFRGTGNPDTGDDYGAAPDLDHANPELRTALVEWLAWLKTEIGFKSWRFDYVRGFGAEFITEYVDGSVGRDALNVGEFWTDAKWNGSDLDYNQDESRQKLCDWIKGTGERSCAFDFPTKAVLQEAVKNTQYNRLRDDRGKAAGLLGWWPGKTMTFIENHDTGSTQQHWPFPADYMAAGYAYILTHPGIPCVFWDHLFTWGEELTGVISSLAALRRRAGVVSDSKLEILAADSDMYVARVADSLVIKLGPRGDMGSLVPSEAEGWKFAMSGKDWAVWEKTGNAPAAPEAAPVAEAEVEAAPAAVAEAAAPEPDDAQLGTSCVCWYCLVIKLGPRGDMGSLVPSEAEGWKFAMSGKDWAVWEKTGNAPAAPEAAPVAEAEVEAAPAAVAEAAAPEA